MYVDVWREQWKSPIFFSLPVPMYIGLLFIAFCLSICLSQEKSLENNSLDKNPYLWNRLTYDHQFDNS